MTAKAFPTACLRIAVATKATAKEIRKRLGQKLGETVGLAHSTARSIEGRICVGTFLYLAGSFEWRRGHVNRTCCFCHLRKRLEATA